MLSLQKNSSFLSFHSPIFHSKISKHPACEMNSYEQEEAGRELEILSEHTFWMTPKSFFSN